jgi:hypothetical protein
MSKLPACLILVTALAASPAGADPDETKRDEAALRAIDDHWGRAEGDGDVAYMTQLLAPGYRSISPTGKATTREALLEHTARRASSVAAREEARKAREAYMAAHPTGVSVVLHGSIGIVSFYDPKRGADQSVRGADVFLYEDHRWRAIYSFHNAAE